MKDLEMMKSCYSETIVIGSGLAGLTCALSLAPRPVALLTKTSLLHSGSSYLAKGGIAVALGPQDSPQRHVADTMLAAAGIGNDRAMLRMALDGIDDVRQLLAAGIPFDRAADGSLELATEAAHQCARVVHGGGDATGQVLVDALIEKVRRTPSITVLEDAVAVELTTVQGRSTGLRAFHRSSGWRQWQSPAIVLATGGIGMLWRHTTNPVEATADGLAMAARAGAVLADLEFVQFHPTALDIASSGNLPLLTEALRGAGATLVDELGHRFMLADHPSAELAPRDVVARSIERQYISGHRAFLDIRPVYRQGLARHFPQAIAAARLAGFDPEREPLPVVPAAHYHMGGVRTDQEGRTSIDGLWACGEVANTGVHGANRLAGNSLLEAMVFARRVATDIASCSVDSELHAQELFQPGPPGIDWPRNLVADVQEIMSSQVGIQRVGAGLHQSLQQLAVLSVAMESAQISSLSDAPTTEYSFDDVRRYAEARNLLLAARLVSLAALRRTESRGAHYRTDFPDSSADWQRIQAITADSLAA